MKVTASITPQWITNYLTAHFADLSVIDTWGEKSFFYNPNGLLKRGTYFCTIKGKDGANDKASKLDRENIFRFNFGIPKETFLTLFSALPKRPTKGNIIEGSYDFTALNCITPHPIYGWIAWISVLNPSLETWHRLELLLIENYKMTIKKHIQKTKRSAL